MGRSTASNRPILTRSSPPLDSQDRDRRIVGALLWHNSGTAVVVGAEVAEQEGGIVMAVIGTGGMEVNGNSINYDHTVNSIQS